MRDITVPIKQHLYNGLSRGKTVEALFLKKNKEGINIMKKYVIIAGVPRAGKSTISKRIAKQKGYQHISMDAILAGIEKNFPECKINTNESEDALKNYRYISSRIAPFIRAMINSGEYEECEYGVVIDVYQLTPKDFQTYIADEKSEGYFIITSDITAEERFNILKQYDTPDDYTYFHSDEQNMNDCRDIVQISNWIKKECGIYNLPYVNTTYNRENIINEFIESLCEQKNKIIG